MALGMSTVLSFILSWIVSSIVIYVVTRFLGDKKGVGTAFLAALVGTAVYIVAYMFLGNGLLAGIFGGIVWLIALGSLYKIGWPKALLIAIVIWLAAYVVGFFLPTLIGPF